jgi:hypothetical protein
MQLLQYSLDNRQYNELRTSSDNSESCYNSSFHVSNVESAQWYESCGVKNITLLNTRRSMAKQHFIWSINDKLQSAWVIKKSIHRLTWNPVILQPMIRRFQSWNGWNVRYFTVDDRHKNNQIVTISPLPYGLNLVTEHLNSFKTNLKLNLLHS